MKNVRECNGGRNVWVKLKHNGNVNGAKRERSNVLFFFSQETVGREEIDRRPDFEKPYSTRVPNGMVHSCLCSTGNCAPKNVMIQNVLRASLTQRKPMRSPNNNKLFLLLTITAHVWESPLQRLLLSLQVPLTHHVK